MADTIVNSEFKFPSDFLMGKENLNRNGFNSAWATFCFPTEFPYQLGSPSLLSSPADPIFGSTVTESDQDYTDFHAGLTRQLAHSTLQRSHNMKKKWVYPSSPQSTLSALGSPHYPSQVSSPPTPPLTVAIENWDLIYAVGGQFARLKTSGEGPPNSRGLVGSPTALTPISAKAPTTGLYSNHSPIPNFSETSHYKKVRQEIVLKQQCSLIWGRRAKEGFIEQNRGERFHGGSQFGWSQQQNEQQVKCGSGIRGVFVGVSGVKRKCAGTGVFLPRRYANPSDTPCKNTGCSTALLPNNTQPQHPFNSNFTSSYDTLGPRSNAILAQQKRSFGAERAVNHEVVLPQEWTY